MTEDTIPPVKNPLIVAITYGSPRDKLSIGTQRAVEEAAWLWHTYGGCVAYAMPANSYHGSAADEHRMKFALLKSLSVRQERILWGQESMNSISEAEAVKHLAEQRGEKFDAVIVVCTAIHSRGIRLIWRHYFPTVKVVVVCLPDFPEIEPGHQIVIQRSRWAWFAANLVRHAAILLLGLEFAKKFSEPAAD
jgi:hypothetical protein